MAQKVLLGTNSEVQSPFSWSTWKTFSMFDVNVVQNENTNRICDKNKPMKCTEFVCSHVRLQKQLSHGSRDSNVSRNAKTNSFITRPKNPMKSLQTYENAYFFSCLIFSVFSNPSHTTVSRLLPCLFVPAKLDWEITIDHQRLHNNLYANRMPSISLSQNQFRLREKTEQTPAPGLLSTASPEWDSVVVKAFFFGDTCWDV